MDRLQNESIRVPSVNECSGKENDLAQPLHLQRVKPPQHCHIHYARPQAIHELGPHSRVPHMQFLGH
eukprot:4836723-Alexandrium_andersonii.AAC.1